MTEGRPSAVRQAVTRPAVDSPAREAAARFPVMRPGRNLLFLALLLIGLSFLAFLSTVMLWVLGALVILITVLAWRDALQAAAALKQVRVTRTLPGIVGRDLTFCDTLRIENLGPTAVVGELRDVLPAACLPRWATFPFRIASSGAGGTPQGPVKLPAETGPETSWLQFMLPCRIPIRGRHRFGPLWVRVAGPLQLLEVQQSLECFDDVKVMPETFVSREELQKDTGAQLLLLDKTLRSRQMGAGTEFVSLFPYRLGDDPRRIDWRATARHRTPIVRRYQVERHRDVMILVDSGRLMGSQTDRGSKLDCAVDACLNLARVALHGGDRCGIGVFDSELRGYLPPIAGPRSLPRLVDCVYDLQTNWRETDFAAMYSEMQRRQSKRSLLVILSDLGDAETSRLHCAALARLSQRHLVLFAALRTPLLRRVIHSQPETLVEGARQAVALGLLRDRDRALHALRHGGIHVVDVEPQQLTLPLINQFIELRRRNLL